MKPKVVSHSVTVMSESESRRSLRSKSDPDTHKNVISSQSSPRSKSSLKIGSDSIKESLSESKLVGNGSKRSLKDLPSDISEEESPETERKRQKLASRSSPRNHPVVVEQPKLRTSGRRYNTVKTSENEESFNSSLRSDSEVTSDEQLTDGPETSSDEQSRSRNHSRKTYNSVKEKSRSISGDKGPLINETNSKSGGVNDKSKGLLNDQIGNDKHSLDSSGSSNTRVRSTRINRNAKSVESLAEVTSNIEETADSTKDNPSRSKNAKQSASVSNSNSRIVSNHRKNSELELLDDSISDCSKSADSVQNIGEHSKSELGNRSKNKLLPGALFNSICNSVAVEELIKSSEVVSLNNDTSNISGSAIDDSSDESDDLDDDELDDESDAELDESDNVLDNESDELGDESDELDESGDESSEINSISDDSEVMIVSPKHAVKAKKALPPVNGKMEVKKLESEESNLINELLQAKVSTSTSKDELVSLVKGLQETLSSIRKSYERKLCKKDEEVKRVRHEISMDVERLKSELVWKDEQIDELNKVAEKNMETEAKISFLLSDKEAYEREVIEYNRPKPVVEQPQINEEEIMMDEESSFRKKRSKRKGCKREKNNGCEADDIDVLFLGQDDTIIVPDDDDLAEMSKEAAVDREVLQDNMDVPGRVMTLVKKPGESVDGEGEDAASKGRHDIRRLVSKLQEETKAAAKAEIDRRDRIKKEREKHLITIETDPKTKQPVCTRMVLAFKDEEKKQPLVEVNKKMVTRLKPHQVEAIEFMWDNVIESMEVLLNKEHDGSKGSGCILAHCMGLGKTLSVITLLHTLLTSKDICFSRCLILSPLNAVLNWVAEWGKWVDKRQRVKIYELSTKSASDGRTETLNEWQKKGGLLVISYQLFRILVSYNGRSKKLRSLYDRCFLEPGPDVLVCDEGHVLKNDSSALSKCVNKVSTRRRIVLTGTPLQNNLIEYHCMVSLVKPSLMGTRREFCNRFVNPITNGQHSDSTQADVKLMKRRAHVLHEMLSGCVQRRDYTALVKFLPPKQEYVIFVRLSPLQIELYQNYLERYASNCSVDPETGSKATGAGLFTDYQYLMRIWTHPWVLQLEQDRQDRKPLTFDDDDELDDSVLFTSSSEAENDDNSDNDSDKHIKEKRISKSARKRIINDEDDDDDDEEDSSSLEKKINKKKTGRSKKTKGAGDSSQQSSDRESSADNESASNGVFDPLQRRAKIIAGEVIREWQTKTRSKGAEEEDVMAGRKTEQWWNKLVKEEHRECLELSGKLVLLFNILRLCEEIGDKVLVFSQSLLSLDLIEDFLSIKNQEAEKHNAEIPEKNRRNILPMSLWKKDEDYLRMDGSTGAQSRTRFTNNFNDLVNTRLRLFLISTKAGGLGINLDSANRVIIFDASWNPSHDVQSIFRVYRFGQLKPCFIYRFLAQGTMEEKIYDRQVTKETLSHRVVDEHQIDRHFTAADLQELYAFKPDKLDDPESASKRPVPAVPKDLILAELLADHKQWIVQYHEHDSLLENRPEENLSEAERLAAWEEFERERHDSAYLSDNRVVQQTFSNQGYMYPNSKIRYITQPYQNMARQNFGPNIQPITVDGSSSSSVSRTGNRMDDATALAISSIPSHMRSRFSFQISQLPRVVQEILKYNPNISVDNLQTRLHAFLGMHNRFASNSQQQQQQAIQQQHLQHLMMQQLSQHGLSSTMNESLNGNGVEESTTIDD